MANTIAAPRIDGRLRAFIAAAPVDASPAEVTRQVGDLAWTLGLTRPSYQRVRVLLADRRPRRGAVSTSAPGVIHYVVKAIETLYEYPGPGLASWYESYRRGGATL